MGTRSLHTPGPAHPFRHQHAPTAWPLQNRLAFHPLQPLTVQGPVATLDPPHLLGELGLPGARKLDVVLDLGHGVGDVEGGIPPHVHAHNVVGHLPVHAHIWLVHHNVQQVKPAAPMDQGPSQSCRDVQQVKPAVPLEQGPSKLQKLRDVQQVEFARLTWVSTWVGLRGD